MPTLKRELAFLEDKIDRIHQQWHLVMDCDAPGLYVEHVSKREGSVDSHDVRDTIQRYGINDFLSSEAHEPARAALIRALKDAFRDGESRGGA
ncbi:MAG TPA: hypothetical protein VIL09_05190 [Microvirga sp.]